MIRRDDGKWVKQNPEVTESKERSLTAFKLALRRGEILSVLKDHPSWIMIQEILTEKIKRLEQKRKEFEKLDHRALDLILQEEKDFLFLRDIVDDLSGSMSGFEEEISRLERELDERKAVIAHG